MNTQQNLNVLNITRKEERMMRNVQTEVLRDVLYHALRQVLRDQNISIVSLRKAYDVVYFQAGEIYYTFSLFMDTDGFYITSVTEQYYNGDIKLEYGFKHHKEESYITDIMNHLSFYVSKITNTSFLSYEEIASSKERPFDKNIWSRILNMSKKYKLEYIFDFSKRTYNCVDIENDNNINSVLYGILYFEKYE